MKGFYVLICKYSSISGSTSAIIAILDLHVKLIDRHATLVKALEAKKYFHRTYLIELSNLNRTILFAALSTSNNEEP